MNDVLAHLYRSTDFNGRIKYLSGSIWKAHRNDGAIDQRAKPGYVVGVVA